MSAKLCSALKTAKTRLQHGAYNNSITDLISVPLAAREGFEQWMRSQEIAGHPENIAKSELSDTEYSSVNHYFCNLVLAINQEMIHSFVHWHEGNKEFADAAWSASGGAMMQATALTNLLGKRGLSPKPECSFDSGMVLDQKIAANSKDAICFGQEIASNCAFAAKQAANAMANSEFLLVCENGVKYFNQVSHWNPGKVFPKIRNPCVSFERVLDLYVWGEQTASSSSV